MKKYNHGTTILEVLISIIIISLVIGLLFGLIIQIQQDDEENNLNSSFILAESTIEKRQKILRLQFKDFLESMNVAVRAGNVEVKAVKSALEDLKLSYNGKADIVKEVENIILQYEGGGKELKVLFEDLANRSNLEDIRRDRTPGWPSNNTDGVSVEVRIGLEAVCGAVLRFVRAPITIL